MNSVTLGQELIEEFPNDFIVNRYKSKQEEYCKQLGVTPSDCVIFGIDKDNQWPTYHRGTSTGRLCFSKIWDGRITV